jgi:hypothetical protein
MATTETKRNLENKQELFLKLASQKQVQEIDTLPGRLLCYEEIAGLEAAYAEKHNACEAWILDPYAVGSGETTITSGGEPVDSSESVIAFALLTDDVWIPFEFGIKNWFQKEQIPHPDGVDLDKQITAGSMDRLSDMNDER